MSTATPMLCAHCGRPMQSFVQVGSYWYHPECASSPHAATRNDDEIIKRAIASVRLFDRLSFKERLQAAIAHAEEHGQMNEALWPHQRFSMSLGELLRAALGKEQGS